MSLRAHLLLAFGAVVLLTTLLAGGYQYRQLRRLLTRADDARLQSRAELLLLRTEAGPGTPTIPLPDQTGEQLRVVYRAPGYAPQELFRSARWPGTGAAGWRVARASKAANLLPADAVEVWLAHPAAPLRRQLQQVWQGLAVAAGGSLVLAALLAGAVSRLALRPLRRITAQARQIQSAPGIALLPEPDTGDEVQELARTLNQMLHRLREGGQLQDNFLAAAAHELRTPLATMRTGLSVALARPDVAAPLAQELQGHLEELRRLSRLVDDFLLVSRLQAQALPLHLAPVALDELLLLASDRLLPRFRAARRPLHLLIDEAAPSYTVSADADKLLTVVLNLLENALRHAPAGAAVHASLSQAPGAYVLTIRNPLLNPLPDLDHLTAPYYRAEVLSDGAGLGLWLSGRIAELHGARLQFHQQEQEFTVELTLLAGQMPPLDGSRSH
ncbi:HAMP domain-containing sensor histidine kinase [Hymenobacter rigui]|uniref:histidine kinase n=1 Tax=Hymenobacter rigui TaxID=334424 RepID=A0A428KVN9_9BACT|nr:histidine kinase dimerization/phospho-acceptor domain-containing protein [Hymenobacter rigui]RSK50806.1 HAMP domain-containing protein [Hymenobacter rigui]